MTPPVAEKRYNLFLQARPPPPPPPSARAHQSIPTRQLPGNSFRRPSPSAASDRCLRRRRQLDTDARADGLPVEVSLPHGPARGAGPALFFFSSRTRTTSWRRQCSSSSCSASTSASTDTGSPARSSPSCRKCLKKKTGRPKKMVKKKSEPQRQKESLTGCSGCHTRPHTEITLQRYRASCSAFFSIFFVLRA